MDIALGQYTIRPASEAPARFAALFWGDAGVGKTTLAATAPGRKLWINFDPNGFASVSAFGEQHKNASTALALPISVLDLSDQPNSVATKFKTEDGLGLGKFFQTEEGKAIDTVVIDSITRFQQMALEHTIKSGLHKGAELERPSPGAYQGRNALALRMIVDMLVVTARYNKHIVFITHEGAPSTNDEGSVLAITMALGGQLPQLSTQQLSEVWHVSDVGGKRMIALRPFRVYKPMKSRMFDLSGETRFEWKYDISKPDPKFEIATWYNKWIENACTKLPVPR